MQQLLKKKDQQTLVFFFAVTKPRTKLGAVSPLQQRVIWAGATMNGRSPFPWRFLCSAECIFHIPLKKTISPAIRAEISFAIREKISNELALNAFSLLTIRKKACIINISIHNLTNR